MKSYHDKQEVKDHFVQNAIKHRELDAFVQGKGDYDDQKGCMIACSFKKYDHNLAPTEAGVPVWLARLADGIFEGLNKAESDTWTEKFWDAIPVGIDLDKAKAPFLIYVLESTLRTFDHVKNPAVKIAVDTVIALYKDPDSTKKQFDDAGSAANAAYAYAAANAAANAANAAYTAGWAAYAAGAGAAARAAAKAAGWAAYAAGAAAGAAAGEAVYTKFADKLIEIMKGLN